MCIAIYIQTDSDNAEYHLYHCLVYISTPLPVWQSPRTLGRT